MGGRGGGGSKQNSYGTMANLHNFASISGPKIIANKFNELSANAPGISTLHLCMLIYPCSNIPTLSFMDNPVSDANVLAAMEQLLPKKGKYFNGISM